VDSKVWAIGADEGAGTNTLCSSLRTACFKKDQNNALRCVIFLKYCKNCWELSGAPHLDLRCSSETGELMPFPTALLLLLHIATTFWSHPLFN